MRSYLPDYRLVIPSHLQGTLQMLASGEGWKPISGGTDLMVLLNAGKLASKKLISVRKLPELRSIDVNETSVRIGAAVTYAEIQKHSSLQADFPLLCQAASWTGGVANQNQGTLGGNIANASPAADSSPALLVYDADIELVSVKESRILPYADFHLAYKSMALRPDELLYAIHLPRRTPCSSFARKVGTRRAQAVSKVAFAAAARLNSHRIEEIRLAFASVAPIPLRCFATENFLLSKALSPSVIAQARTILRAEIAPIDDIRSTGLYRSLVAQNLLSQFLENLP